MLTLQGKSIYKGISIGKIFYYRQPDSLIRRRKISDVDSELERFDQAKSQAKQELDLLYQKALKELGEVNAQIFEVHSMMIDDDDFNDSIVNMITSNEVNAEYAVGVTGDNFADMFAAMDDEYFQARAADIKDISDRLVRCLSGAVNDNQLTSPSILLANDLAPSETVQLDKSLLLGFVTKLGSTNSHTAILARTMNLPALIGIDVQAEWHGKLAIIDGVTGSFIVDPDQEVLAKYQKLRDEAEAQEALLKKLKGKQDITKSGHEVKLYANVGDISDVRLALENDARGIGLFRSEFLYLKGTDFPSEEEQFNVYRQVAEIMAGKPVIIRTLDIGADKQIDYFNLPKEENPALGYRAIRICLKRKEIFRTQLRALLRASAYGNIAIMYPMIISLEEIRQIKQVVEEVKADLRKNAIQFKDVDQGIMIETPAAAMLSDVLAKEVDFFSIGTNDLTQYTLAIDRQNPELEDFYDSHHPAVLKLIELTAQNAHKHGIWCGICGELAADTSLTQTFMDYGIDELSVSPPMVLAVRQEIINAD